MIKDAKIIIGANFGDEGKGLMTDYMCSKCEKPIVVRFNSGPQAGHTVERKDGSRHVYGHFGAGSTIGAPTFLSEYFVVNPLLYFKELESLISLGVSPKVYVDKTCLVTTPYDMIINQLIETIRNENRHGSCGLGFNETIERSKVNKYKITIGDIVSGDFKNKLLSIRDEYLPIRLKELGVDSIPYDFKEIIINDGLLNNFIQDSKRFYNNIVIADINSICKQFQTIVFEGAQGLMLHQNYKYFPHVTRSNTGVENVIDLINKLDCSFNEIEAVYITRSYLTRHGAGPLENELFGKVYDSIEDKTNIPNEFQGSLRFAPLDINVLSNNINFDFSKSKCSNIKKSIAITCLDQIDNNNAKYIVNGKLKESTTECFVEDMISMVKPEHCYLSFGPCRENVIVKK